MTADIRQGRWTAEVDGDFVVFLIGARINSKRAAIKVFLDFGGRRGMNHMLKYLTAHPDKGLLGYQSLGFTVIQYWRSFEHLEAFAKDTEDPHLDVWRSYWKRVGKRTRAGVWHETYLVRAGEYEAIYLNMPPTGLGQATTLVPLAESLGARQRLKATPARPRPTRARGPLRHTRRWRHDRRCLTRILRRTPGLGAPPARSSAWVGLPAAKGSRSR